jgi:hypothetical protein
MISPSKSLTKHAPGIGVLVLGQHSATKNRPPLMVGSICSGTGLGCRRLLRVLECFGVTVDAEKKKSGNQKRCGEANATGLRRANRQGRPPNAAESGHSGFGMAAETIYSFRDGSATLCKFGTFLAPMLRHFPRRFPAPIARLRGKFQPWLPVFLLLAVLWLWIFIITYDFLDRICYLVLERNWAFACFSRKHAR